MPRNNDKDNGCNDITYVPKQSRSNRNKNVVARLFTLEKGDVVEVVAASIR